MEVSISTLTEQFRILILPLDRHYYTGTQVRVEPSISPEIQC
jgi:hypothetical protein